MKYKRQFIIVAYFNNGIKFEVESYIKKIIKNGLGYYYIRTVNPKKAKIWKVRKRCETAIDKINNLLDPTKYFLKKYKFYADLVFKYVFVCLNFSFATFALLRLCVNNTSNIKA